MCVLSIYVDACGECQTGEAVWLRKEEEEIIGEKKGESLREFFKREVNVVPCWQSMLSVCAPFPNSSSASCHSAAAVEPH